MGSQNDTEKVLSLEKGNMGTAVMDFRAALETPSEVGALGVFFQPTPECDEKLVSSDERLVSGLLRILDQQLLDALEARTAKEFVSRRSEILPRYARALRALSDTVVNLVSREFIASVSEKVISDLSADLGKQEACLGAKLVEQAVFTLWTVQKLGYLSMQVVAAGKAPEARASEDAELCQDYHYGSLWAQFHLDILFTAIKFGRVVRQELHEEICDGLRASVNAYASMREAYLLRQPQEGESTIPGLPWDQEDEHLLASSMRDLDGDASDRD